MRDRAALAKGRVLKPRSIRPLIWKKKEIPPLTE